MIQTSAPEAQRGRYQALWPGQNRQCGYANVARYRHCADDKAGGRGMERWPPTLDYVQQILPGVMRFSPAADRLSMVCHRKGSIFFFEKIAQVNVSYYLL